MRWLLVLAACSSSQSAPPTPCAGAATHLCTRACSCAMNGGECAILQGGGAATYTNVSSCESSFETQCIPDASSSSYSMCNGDIDNTACQNSQLRYPVSCGAIFK
jgi:hypothetical protein